MISKQQEQINCRMEVCRLPNVGNMKLPLTLNGLTLEPRMSHLISRLG